MSFQNSYRFSYSCLSFVLQFLYRDDADPSVDSSADTTEGKHDDTANEDVEEKEKMMHLMQLPWVTQGV